MTLKKFFRCSDIPRFTGTDSDPDLSINKQKIEKKEKNFGKKKYFLLASWKQLKERVGYGRIVIQ
jgi:hypothetical protein